MTYKHNSDSGYRAIGDTYVSRDDGMGEPPRTSAANSRPPYSFDRREMRQHGEGGATTRDDAAGRIGRDSQSRARSSRAPPRPQSTWYRADLLCGRPASARRHGIR